MQNQRAYRVYLILSGASTFLNSLMYTVLTVYYVTVAGLNPLQLVLVGTAMEITVFIFEIPTGIVADVYSRRLSVIIGTIISGASFVMIGLVDTFALIALWLSIWGIGATFLSGAREAWIVDEVGEDHIDKVFMRTSQIRNIASFFGVFVSVALASIALSLPIVLGGALTVLLGIYLIFAMPETGWTPQPRAERNPWRQMGNTLSSGIKMTKARSLMLWFLVLAVAFGAYSEAFDRLGEAHFLLNFDFPQIGNFEPVVWFGILQAGGQLLGFIAAGAAVRWLRLDSQSTTIRILIVLQILWVAVVFWFGLTHSFFAVLCAFWAIGVIRTLHGPLYSAWQNRHIDSSVRATSLSFLNQADSFGQFTGGPLIGGIGTLFTLRAALVAAGLFLLPAFALYRRGQTQVD